MSTAQGSGAIPYWSCPIGPVNSKLKCLLLLKNSFGFLLRDFGLLPAILAGAFVFIRPGSIGPPWTSQTMYRAPASETLEDF